MSRYYLAKNFITSGAFCFYAIYYELEIINTKQIKFKIFSQTLVKKDEKQFQPFTANKSLRSLVFSPKLRIAQFHCHKTAFNLLLENFLRWSHRRFMAYQRELRPRTSFPLTLSMRKRNVRFCKLCTKYNYVPILSNSRQRLRSLCNLYVKN